MVVNTTSAKPRLIMPSAIHVGRVVPYYYEPSIEIWIET